MKLTPLAPVTSEECCYECIGRSYVYRGRVRVDISRCVYRIHRACILSNRRFSYTSLSQLAPYTRVLYAHVYVVQFTAYTVRRTRRSSRRGHVEFTTFAVANVVARLHSTYRKTRISYLWRF